MNTYRIVLRRIGRLWTYQVWQLGAEVGIILLIEGSAPDKDTALTRASSHIPSQQSDSPTP